MFAPLVAQNTQIGATIGRGGAAQLLEDSAYHFVAGVEGCVRCGGRLGLYLEYNHWKKTGAGTGNPTSLDLAGGGLRVQGKGRRVRPFFDAGLVAGVERNDRGVLPRFVQSQTVFGGMLGFGAAISVSEHWYVRPLVKFGVLSTREVAGFWGASVGYRF